MNEKIKKDDFVERCKRLNEELNKIYIFEGSFDVWIIVLCQLLAVNANMSKYPKRAQNHIRRTLDDAFKMLVPE